MDKLYTATEAAEILGISSARVRKIAQDRNLGMQLSSSTWIFSEADLDKMKVRKSGHPPITQITGNWLETLVKLEEQGIINDVNDAYIVVRPRDKHQVIAETKNPEGKKLYIVVDK